MFSYFEVNKKIDNHTCCACLETESNKYIDLKENCDISQLYEFCVGISVLPEDIVPQVLCERCIKIIQEYACFKKQCQASYDLCKSILNQEKFYNENCISTEVKKESDADEDILDNSIILHDDFSNDVHDLSKGDKNYINEKRDINKKTKNPTIGIKKFKKFDMKNVHITYRQENNDHSGKDGLVKVLECTKCKKQYQKVKCLVKHMTQSCYQYNDFNNLVVVKKFVPPFSKYENKPNELFCGLCDFSSTSRNDIKNHLNEHWNDSDIRCKLCSYVGKDAAELFGHRSVHQPYEFFSKLDNRSCHICDKRCVTHMRLQFHYRLMHLNTSGGLCSVCRKSFKCYTAWRNHERLHKSSKYICDLCGNKFLFRHQIKTHLADHSDIRSSICDVCGKGFKRASYLKEHLNTVHVVQPVKCTHCDKTFKCPANLKEHLKHVGKARHFHCEVCSKRFPTAASLKSHAFWHTGERPHACETCGARYKAKAQLKIHMRKHTGQKPYRCLQCDKCFPTAVQLKRHGSVHTGDRPYKCTACSRSFHYKKLLVTHCAAKHGRIVKPEKVTDSQISWKTNKRSKIRRQVQTRNADVTALTERDLINIDSFQELPP